MTVQDTRTVESLAGLDLAPEQADAPAASRRPVRRLPVHKDWPTWALVTVHVGILVGALSLWELGARAAWTAAFFWSQPSAIANTMGLFFATGEAWTDILFPYLSTFFGFLLGAAAGSLLGLSYWWSRN